jgi:AraC family transcriptional regulator
MLAGAQQTGSKVERERTEMQQEFNLTQFGQVLGQLETPSFTIREKSYLPNLRIPRHRHDTVVMSFPLTGSFVEANSISRYTCEPFGLSINPAGESHASDFCAHKARCLIVEVKSRSLPSINESAQALARPLYLQGVTAAALALRVYRELKSADEASALMCEGLMLELVALAMRDRLKDGAAKPPRWLVRARDYLHAHFSEQISLQQLGQIVGVHHAHLARMFRRHYRRAIGEYVRELRLDKSMRELSEPEKPLAEIAAAAGFYDQSHFANAFKRHIGLTPSEFRRTHARVVRPTTL